MLGDSHMTHPGGIIHGTSQDRLDGVACGMSDSFNDMLILPGDPFPDFEWAANFDFTNLDWAQNTFDGQ